MNEMPTEINPMAKKWRKGLRRIALVYPNRYVGGISNIGIQYIYHRINSMDDFICERFYTDVFNWIRSVESGAYLKDFDIALFSIQYEEDAFNAYEIIKRSGFKGLKVAGGPCIMENPLPYSFFDLMFTGELEGSNFIDEVLLGKEPAGKGTYIPGKTERVERVYSELDSHLQTQIIGDGAYGRALLLEIGRGCYRNCRFCIVRQIYAPCRWRKKEILLEVAEKHRKVVDKVALIAPSPSDHPQFREIIFELAEMGFSVSPSSIRADKLDEEILEFLANSGLKTLTFAPEAGSGRLRRVISKGISKDDIINASIMASESGIEKIKLYFMIGLPGENMDDIRAITDMVEEVRRYVRRVEVSINPLVPKPHTPFQWLAFGGGEGFNKAVVKEIKSKMKYLLSSFRKKGVESKPFSVEEFAVQTVLSRGGKDVALLIEKGKERAFRNIFHLGLDSYLDSMIDRELPWMIVDHGYDIKRLEKEFGRAMKVAHS
jgi:radical SAM superfamily enzyme YgiQ (UPF0313 family)